MAMFHTIIPTCVVMAWQVSHYFTATYVGIVV